MIKDLGTGVVNAWEGLRPVTKKLVVGALNSGSAGLPSAKFSYDAHADWELSRLLSALDEQTGKAADARRREIDELAETCVRLLEEQSGSAEVFIQLAERALHQHDYDQFEKLSYKLFERFSPSEIAEVVRQAELPHIKAIGYETLVMLPVAALLPLLDDSLYAEIAIYALEQKAYEFESEEARDLLDQLEYEASINQG